MKDLTCLREKVIAGVASSSLGLTLGFTDGTLFNLTYPTCVAHGWGHMRMKPKADLITPAVPEKREEVAL